jgi:hypothetical protein
MSRHIQQTEEPMESQWQKGLDSNGKTIKPYLDWVPTHLRFRGKAVCSTCKKKFFGGECVIRRLYEKIYDVYCATCGEAQR